MEIQVVRKWGGASYCASDVYIDGKLFCQAVEDIERTYQGKPLEKSMGADAIKSVKVPKETAIPRGKYAVALTHSNHFAGKEPYKSVAGGIVPAVVGVPGYTGIRIHCGTHAGHSEGCLLLGQNPGDKYKGKNQNSRETWIAFWNLVKGQSNIAITYTGPEGAAGLSGESMEGVISGAGGGGQIAVTSYKIPECPPNIKFKRLWSMYREKSKTETYIGDFGSVGSGVEGFGGDVSSITDEMVSYLGLETKESALFLLNSISQFEGGIKWTDAFGHKELHGYGDTSDNPGHHRTFAFGMLYDPESNGFMDEHIPPGGWTEDILRRKFLVLCKKHVMALQDWKARNNINISEEWFVALCHFHHWSPTVPNGMRSDPYWDCLSNPFRWLAGDMSIKQRYPSYQDALWSIFITSGKAGGERRNSKYYKGWKRRYYDFQLEHAR